jgi:ABC-type polysaccharide/polyol phosphate export permease
MVGFILFLIAYTIATSFNPMIILVIPVLFLQILFSLGLGMLFAAVIPYVRDIGHILGFVMQGIFFLSPIIYSMEIIPEKLKIVFYLNPITYFVSSYHKLILLRELPSPVSIGVIFLISTGLFIFGYRVFQKLKDGFADVL